MQFAFIGHLLGNNMKNEGTGMKRFLYLKSLLYRHGYLNYQKLTRSQCGIVTAAVGTTCFGLAMKRMIESMWGLGTRSEAELGRMNGIPSRTQVGRDVTWSTNSIAKE